MRYFQLRETTPAQHSHTKELDASGLVLGDYDLDGNLTGVEVLDFDAPYEEAYSFDLEGVDLGDFLED